MRLIIGLCCLCILQSAFGFSNFIIAPLTYTKNYQVNSNIPNTVNIKTLNATILNQLKLQLPSFDKLVLRQLASNGSWGVSLTPTVDTASIKRWENANNNNEQQIDNTDSSQYSNIIHNYILIGFIKEINTNYISKKFNDSNYLSVLYNFDMIVEYKIIDVKNNLIVSSFIACGSSGISDIVQNNNPIIDTNVNINSLVTQILTSLAFSVQHGIIVKSDLGLLP
jgi:hypothetical protein